jgi:hypothetical protein
MDTAWMKRPAIDANLLHGLSTKQREQIARDAATSVQRRAGSGQLQARDYVNLRSAVTPQPPTGPVSKVRLELIEVTANQTTREISEDGDEMTFGAVAVLPDLSTRPLGPFRIPGKLKNDGETRRFDPPIEVATCSLSPMFPTRGIRASQAARALHEMYALQGAECLTQLALDSARFTLRPASR